MAKVVFIKIVNILMRIESLKFIISRRLFINICNKEIKDNFKKNICNKNNNKFVVSIGFGEYDVSMEYFEFLYNYFKEKGYIKISKDGDFFNECFSLNKVNLSRETLKILIPAIISIITTIIINYILILIKK